MDRFIEQVQAAESRYHDRAKARDRRLSHLDKGDWREVDEPSRILKRLTDLGHHEVVGLAMASMATTAEGFPELNVLERIIDDNELISSQFLLDGARASRSVGRIVIRQDGTTLGFGTGFLVSPQLLLTNNHVLGSATTAADSTVQFNFLEDFGGRPSTPIAHDLTPGAFFETDQRLDFTLVAVEEVNDGGHRLALLGWSPLTAESGKAIVGELVNIIQHPGGEPQQIAIRMNRIEDVVADFLHYSADTERGSSGSPVFNDQWRLAALHHAGVPDRDENGRILLVSGQPWDGSAATVGQVKWVANEGVRISRIVARLEDKSVSWPPAKRSLFAAAF